MISIGTTKITPKNWSELVFFGCVDRKRPVLGGPVRSPQYLGRSWTGCGPRLRVLGTKNRTEPDLKTLPLDTEGVDMNSCSLVVTDHIGLKLTQCHMFYGSTSFPGLTFTTIVHPYIKHSVSPSPSPIKNHLCPSWLTIFIPTDLALQFALVVHLDNTPHNHPIPQN
jgi:hypothetical protein